MDLVTFKASLKSVLGRDVSDLAVSLAVDELTQELRILEMEASTSIAANTGGNLFVPADFMAVVSLRREDGGLLTPASTETASNAIGDAPAEYFLRNGLIKLWPAPAAGHLCGLVYVARLAPLVNNGDTNAALEYARDAMTYVTLKHHAALMRDQTAFTFFEGQAARAITAANQADIKRRWSGGTSRPASGRTIV